MEWRRPRARGVHRCKDMSSFNASVVSCKDEVELDGKGTRRNGRSRNEKKGR